MHLTPIVPFAVALIALGASFPSSMARPDEGMWLFDGLPLKVLKEKYNFEPTPQWLEHVRLGSVRFDSGGSGSFVSPNGLVMTNHHVALSSLQEVSTPETDWVEPGFSAMRHGSEVPTKGLTIRQLVEIRDITAQVLEWKGADKSEKGNEWRGKLDDFCKKAVEGKPGFTADSVPLYDGNQYRLHVYRVYDDIRFVFAPEKQIGYYGGDYDNFTFPRYCLDCTFFRIYDDGKPLDSSKFYFPFDVGGAATDELVFVSGHPGSTDRALTFAEMEFDRDVRMPNLVRAYTMFAERVKKQMDADPKKAFELRDQYFGVLNSLKSMEGQLAGLRTAEMLEKIKVRDQELLAKSGKPEVKAAFDQIAAEVAKLREKFSGRRLDMQALQQSLMDLAATSCADAKKVINDARFAVYGAANYPDATFTLRLAYGTVKNYVSGTTLVAPRTTFHGLYERNQGHDNKAPYDLPQRWLDAKSKLNLDTPFNFVCTADIIGGNSGSPILDRDAKVVGLVFDGNIESLPGNYWFDERVNRCVGVHTAGMIEALKVVYGEAALVAELLGEKTGK